MIGAFWPLSGSAADWSGRARDIQWEDRLLVAPKGEPLDLADVKIQRRLPATPSAFDVRFAEFIAAARQQLEEETGLQLLTATRQCLLETFPIQRTITVGRGPVQIVTRVAYLDATGVEQTLDPATYTTFPPPAAEGSPSIPALGGPFARPGGIQLAATATWPAALDQPGAVRITYLAGFGDTADTVPALLKYALHQYVGDFHRFAENQVENIKTDSIAPIGSTMVTRRALTLMLSPARMTRW